MKKLLPLCLLPVLAFAQAAPKSVPTVAPVTPEEEITILAQEKEQLQLQQQLQAAIENSPQYKALSAANQRLQASVDALYASRKTTPKEQVLCEGPTPLPACADVKPGRIALRPVEAKK